MGMGMGSPLLTGIMAGGLGYMLGSNNNNQNQAQQAPPAYPAQYTPAAPVPPAGQPPTGDGGMLAQLTLLGQLHESGTLTDEEFTTEKQRILSRN